MKMFLCDIGSFFYKGAMVIHADVPDDAKKVPVGKVEKVISDDTVKVNWDKGAAFGEYSPSQLVIYDPY